MDEMLKKQNFISVDKKTVRSSYGEYFTVDEMVGHEDNEAGEAKILSFEPDKEKNEIRVNTTKGFAYVDFLVKIEKVN